MALSVKWLLTGNDSVGRLREMKDTTWRKCITVEMAERGDSFDNMVSVAPADVDLDKEFDPGYGSANGAPFTLWTKTRVYFPVVYDGAEWVSSVPRDPCDVATEHVGGQ